MPRPSSSPSRPATLGEHHLRHLLRVRLAHQVGANAKAHVLTSAVAWLSLVTLLSQVPLPVAVPLLGGNLGALLTLASLLYWLPVDPLAAVVVAALTVAWSRCPGGAWGPGHGWLAGVLAPVAVFASAKVAEHFAHVYHHDEAPFLGPATLAERLHDGVWGPFHFVTALLLRAGWRPGLAVALDAEERRALGALRRVSWSNWARLASCRAEHVWAPRSVDELALAVTEARALGLRVRVVASGFSWSSLAVSDEALIFCERLVGITVDPTGVDGPRAWVEAGVTNRLLNAELARHQLCMPWNVVLETVRIAGTVSTGTHGTGKNTATLGDLVEALEVIDAEGRKRVLSEETVGAETMSAARMGLGVFGVIARVKLKVVPLHRVELVDRRAFVPDVLAKLPELVRAHDAIELYWFPFNRDAWIRTIDRTLAPHTQRGHGVVFKAMNLLQNLWAVGAFRLVMRFAPGLTPSLLKVAFRMLPFGTRVVDLPASHHYRHWVEVMPAGCMEVGFKADADLGNVLRAWRATEELVDAYTARGLYPLNLSLNMRFIGASDALLSPAYGAGLTCYIEIMFMGRPEGWETFSAELCAAWLSNPGALPHLGKELEHVPDVAAVVRTNLGDRRGRFLRALASTGIDPDGVFFNPLVRRLLGDAEPPS